MEDEGQVIEYMQFIIQDICEKIGPRPPCSPEEAKGGQYFESELKKYADKTQIEPFYCHPGSYKAQFQVPILSLISTTIFYWLYFVYQNLLFLLFPIGILIFSLIVIQTNIMRNTEFIDPLFKRKESTNVFGKFKPLGQVKQTIVIGGHHDSNWEFPILRKSWKVFGLLMVLPIILNYIFFGIFIIKLIFHILANQFFFVIELDLTFLILLTCLAPILIYWAFNIVSNRPVMGANDNLTALAVILAISSKLKNLKLANTEVWLVSHGCEEIGDRGSKKFSKIHYNELKNALVINLDMIGGKNTKLRFVTSEVIFLVKLSEEMVVELAKIANELNIPYQKGRVEAFTDSMAYAMNNVQTCSIIGFPDKGVPPFYHTREDTIENLDFTNLWDCYRLLLKFITKIDKGAIFTNN